MITFADLFLQAAGNFLCDTIPKEEFQSMSSEEWYQHCKSNAWGPFTYHPGDLISDYIEENALTWGYYLQAKGLPVDMSDRSEFMRHKPSKKET